jgi:hypothetical protein
VVAAGENPNSGIHQVLDADYRITDICELFLSWGMHACRRLGAFVLHIKA